MTSGLWSFFRLKTARFKIANCEAHGRSEEEALNAEEATMVNRAQRLALKMTTITNSFGIERRDIPNSAPESYGARI
jgi:hypothetical protein